MKLDALVIAAHPDDAEIGCGGTIAKLVDLGKQVGILDMTRGELGTRGSAEQRDVEAMNAAKILGVVVRDNFRFRDGFFVNNEPHQLAIIAQIRKYRPDIVITNAPKDRHSDHGKASGLVRDAAFLSGLAKITTSHEGKFQEAWRPKKVFYFIQDYHLQPDFVIDISSHFQRKMDSLKAYESQFFNPEYQGKETYISTSDFWDFLEARARNMGHMVGVSYGEGFVSDVPLMVDTPLDLRWGAKS